MDEGATIETTLELRASSVGDVKGRMHAALFKQRLAHGRVFWTLCCATSRARRRAGCGPRRRMIRALSASRRSLAEVGGTPMRCVIYHAGWQRVSAGDGTKGAPLHDRAYIERADIDAADYGQEHHAASKPLTLSPERYGGRRIRRAPGRHICARIPNRNAKSQNSYPSAAECADMMSR